MQAPKSRQVCKISNLIQQSIISGSCWWIDGDNSKYILEPKLHKIVTRRKHQRLEVAFVFRFQLLHQSYDAIILKTSTIEGRTKKKEKKNDRKIQFISFFSLHHMTFGLWEEEMKKLRPNTKYNSMKSDHC